MLYPSYAILYVNNPLASADFYSNLLGSQPTEAMPTFALFALENGLRFGLWSKQDVQPKAAAILGGSSELGILVANTQAVHELYEDWKKKGITIIQDPTRMDFGLNFVAVDPDGHRLRVFEHS
ncbi:bleomycin resistance protein [Legionella nautarum]|uniref:Bleomycin resistance protein n=1 Tax=Legionella nautarum TaxID=45070 RepID=A0A0W0WX17_9GAMM|nr:VOC family protein [Legionella nautarum]KTD36774.1 bleomycin resistance protein [Legionella nautarum]